MRLWYDWEGTPVGKKLLSRVEFAESGCWNWFGGKWRDGYGEVRVDGRMQAAHRVAYKEWVGRIPHGLYVLHHCDNPACINPAHLFVGDQYANMGDCKDKGRCGDHKGELNGRAILSEEDVVSIRKLYTQGVTITKLACEFKMSMGAIANIVRGRTWKHLL